MENNLKEKHLLVIDDEVEITKSLVRQFRRKYVVHTATSGEEALDIMNETPVQVVLSDQRMPGMTGVDFFTKIKDKHPESLKLILTGYSDIEAVIDAINEGQVFRYLTKPWNPAELEVSIDEAFERHSLITRNKQLVEALKSANASLEGKVKARTMELELANSRLKDLNIEKNQYVGMVAHDLRNPIGNILNVSDLLLLDFQTITRTEQQEFLEMIKERSSYSLNLIEGFLDISKIESGILDLNFKTWDIVDIVQACISQNGIFARRKSQTISLDSALSPVDRLILCDKDKMEQVIDNLISNAIKYSDTGKQIWISCEMKDLNLVISIKDEGRGISKEELNSIFAVYQTTSTSATAGEKSTGLGLAIAQKIVEAHNGKITVESQLGRGSEFRVQLPYHGHPMGSEPEKQV